SPFFKQFGPLAILTKSTAIASRPARFPLSLARSLLNLTCPHSLLLAALHSLTASVLLFFASLSPASFLHPLPLARFLLVRLLRHHNIFATSQSNPLAPTGHPAKGITFVLFATFRLLYLAAES